MNVYPIPSNNFLFIDYELAKPANVNAHLYNTNGEAVKTLLSDQHLSTGDHRLFIENLDLPDGVYWLQFNVNGNITIKKTIILN